ncbi:hypothetical protein H1R20_g4819, partial [Candolleomyces eurysporus]
MLQAVLHCADRPTSNIQHQLLSHAQLCRKLKEKKEKRNKEHIELLNREKALKCLQDQAQLWNELLELLGTHDV